MSKTDDKGSLNFRDLPYPNFFASSFIDLTRIIFGKKAKLEEFLISGHFLAGKHYLITATVKINFKGLGVRKGAADGINIENAFVRALKKCVNGRRNHG